MCDLRQIADEATVKEAMLGIRRVLDGNAEAFSIEYPRHTPTEQRWYVMHVAPIEHPGGGVIISHVNVSKWVSERKQSS